jgi:hypothetical protein
VGRLLKWIPQKQEGHEAGVADEHVVVEERGTEEDWRAENVEQADQDGVGC